MAHFLVLFLLFFCLLEATRRLRFAYEKAIRMSLEFPMAIRLFFFSARQRHAGERCAVYTRDDNNNNNNNNSNSNNNNMAIRLPPLTPCLLLMTSLPVMTSSKRDARTRLFKVWPLGNHSDGHLAPLDAWIRFSRAHWPL